MSQARITLRPPPNVEFVQGYPGIPASAPERPHAEVKGTIELRLGAQGVKAKWVRVELRKVETLPGGGQANTFYDFVGPSPVKVWEADGGADWSWLHTQDFPFSIRIPESVPPTITLDKSAGIKYELIATLCMKGKKGLFRKAATPTLSTMTPIIIDKHELHSMWPVYAQPESRHTVDELLTLVVDRSNTCFGPGDRVKVTASFKNDGVTVASLRAFEFLLKETIIFRAGPHVLGKKGAPQVYVSPVGEQKVPVNATIYGGQQHRAELGCFIPQTHTTATVNAARHIDIAYSITVKAVLSSGKPLLLEFPVTISNWPRNMSAEAVRRIGPSPNLSLMSPAQYQAMQIQRNPQEIISVVRPNAQSQADHNQNFNTAPGRMGPPLQVRPHQIQERVAQHLGQNNNANANTLPARMNGVMGATRSSYDEFGYAMPSGNVQANGYTTLQDDLMSGDTRRQPLVNTNAVNRLTIANMTHDPEPDTPPSEAPPSTKFPTAEEEKRRLRNAYNNTGASGSSSSAQASKPVSVPTPVQQPQSQSQSPAPASSSPPSRTPWPTAEEEKQRLFENARQQVIKVQAQMGNNVSPTPSQSFRETDPTESRPLTTPTATASSNSTPKRSTPWPTAEEEKMRLYDHARNIAAKTQAEVLGESANNMQTSAAPPMNQMSSSSGPSNSMRPGSSGQRRANEMKSAGAQLYQHAVASMNRVSIAPEPVPKPASPTSPPLVPSPRGSPTASRSRFPTAEEEKAAFRYYEAKRAVERHQQFDDFVQSPVPGDDPIAYDALYPGASSSQAQSSSSQARNLAARSSSPPMSNPHQSGHRIPSGHRSNGSLNDANGSFLPSVTPPDSPSIPPPVPSSTFNSAMSEKERLRQKYAAEDAAVTAGPPPSPPPRTSGNDSPPGYGGPPAPRAQPMPPVMGSGSRPLTAAEEKARLRAQFEAEDAAAGSGSSAGPSVVPSYSPPPASSQLPPSFSRSHSLSYNDTTRSDVGRTSSVAYGKRASVAPTLIEHSESHEEFVHPPLPPPLPAKPPVEYIQETQEEDARMQAEDYALAPSIEATLSRDYTLYKPQPQPDHSRVEFGLSFRPFSPLNLDINFDNLDKSGRPTPTGTPGPSFAPPLPPKVPVLD